MPTERYNEYPPSREERVKNDIQVDVRYLTRTPSPTPSEAEALAPQKKRRPGIILSLLDFERMKDPKELVRTLITLAVIAIVVLFIVFQQNIVNWLRPVADWMHRTPGGWLIPIAILVVLSFPPLFGHEIVAVLVGDVWGVGIGFAIVAAGTILGELATYCVFRWFCMARGKKMEEKKLQYALLAEVVRQGGFKIAVMIRYSAIPGHLTTALFASCGMGVFTFLAAAFLSLPKQLATVYLGEAQSGVTISHTTKIIKTVVIILTVVITLFAMRFVRWETDKVKEEVIYRRRKARQAKLRVAAGMNPDPEASLDLVDPVSTPLLSPHEETIRLEGVTLHVPRPQRVPSSGFAPPPSTTTPGSWRTTEAYGISRPQPGYDARGRSPFRSPQPSSVPYGSA
ncbi:hypothetical protein BD414DRAFT_474892 [Trametes punicea]|nr:hypothetical protein BD414DRAFT_474892 [Trametes punicea]